MTPPRKAPSRAAASSGTPKPRPMSSDTPVVANGKSPTRSGAVNDVVWHLRTEIFLFSTDADLHRKFDRLLVINRTLKRISRRNRTRYVTRCRRNIRWHTDGFDPNIKSKRPTKPSHLLDYVLYGFILSLVVYALLGCPSDTRLESPICRAIQSWRLTLEPYVVKPINSLTSHPSIQPVIRTIKPRYNKAVRRATPILRAIQKTVGPRIQALRARTRAVSQPYIRRLQLEYNIRLRSYVAQIEPYYRVPRRHLVKQWTVFQAELRPLVDRAQIFMLERWENTIKPNALIPAWECIRSVPVWLDSRFGEKARSLKSAYIDEQIKKMRSKFEELAGRSTASTSISTITKTSFAASSPRGHVTIEDVKSYPIFATAPVGKAAIETVVAVEDVPHRVVAATSHSPGAAPATTPLSTIAATASPASSSEFSNVEVVVEPEVGTFHSGSSPSHASDAPESALEDDPLEFLASFTAEPSATTTTTSEVPAWTGPSEEEITRRKRETAEMRKNLEKRHADWEAKVEEEGRAMQERFVDDIMRIRSDAVSSLSKAAGDPDSIGAQVAAFKVEGTKALKGTHAYVDKLTAGHHHGAEKIGLFESVAKKVDQRYSESAQALSEKIAAWWADIRDEIDRIAIKAGDDVNGVALDGQADMGMDYSYLDDVSTRDWTVSI